MGYSDNMESFIMRIVERTLGNRKSERHGLVTSYDPKTHRAKVRFQPSGQTSGWLPIETGHIGNGYGIAVGLNTGDGEKTGDQVVVRFDVDDFEGGKIVQRVHSTVDKPPQVESGEMVIYTQWGQQIRFNKDGTLTFKTGLDTDADQPAQSTLSSPQGTPQQPPTTQQPGQPVRNKKKVTVTLDDKGNHTIDAETTITQNAQKQINDNAQESWTSTAPTLNTVGNTHLGSKGGKFLSMYGTVDSAGHIDLPPVASKVWAT